KRRLNHKIVHSFYFLWFVFNDLGSMATASQFNHLLREIPRRVTASFPKQMTNRKREKTGCHRPCCLPVTVRGSFEIILTRPPLPRHGSHRACVSTLRLEATSRDLD